MKIMTLDKRLSAALLIPLFGLAGLWGWTDHWTSQGTLWEVPVRGFDPRDFLRGHYIEFGYDWPTGEPEAKPDENGQFPPMETQYFTKLCLYGTAPKITRAVKGDAIADDCPHIIKAVGESVYGDESLLRGRLYIPQARSLEMTRKLQDPKLRGIVTFRLRMDGRIIPQSIRFEKR